jgi:nuclear pore complex protein Nup98-Nup96
VSGTGQVKFAPPSGSDTVTKNGVQTTINTNHQCITAMKEYEGKSLEELRYEDYQANRKFPQNQPSGAGTAFGTTGGLFSTGTTAGTTSGGFGSLAPATTTGGLFGSSTATQNKPLFGSSTPTTTGLFGSQNTQNTANQSSFFGVSAAQPAAAAQPFSGFGGSTTVSISSCTIIYGLGKWAEKARNFQFLSAILI